MQDRTETIAGRMMRWARLRKIARKDKKVPGAPGVVSAPLNPRCRCALGVVGPPIWALFGATNLCPPFPTQARATVCRQITPGCRAEWAVGVRRIPTYVFPPSVCLKLPPGCLI